MWTGMHLAQRRGHWRDLANTVMYDGVSKSFRTGGLERELQMVQLCH
jgi:hypothetical protein